MRDAALEIPICAQNLLTHVTVKLAKRNTVLSNHCSHVMTAEAATLQKYPNFRFFMTNRALNDTAQFDLTNDDKNCDALLHLVHRCHLARHLRTPAKPARS